MSDAGNTIGDFRFGLDSQEKHSDFVASLYRELETLEEWGEVPAGTTFANIADAILDTIFGYSQMTEIPATELPTLIIDALEQIKEEQ